MVVVVQKRAQHQRLVEERNYKKDICLIILTSKGEHHHQFISTTSHIDHLDCSGHQEILLDFYNYQQPEEKLQFLQRTRTRSKFMFKEEGREDLMESARDDFRTNLDHVNKYHMLSKKSLVFQQLIALIRLLGQMICYIYIQA